MNQDQLNEFLADVPSDQLEEFLLYLILVKTDSVEEEITLP